MNPVLQAKYLFEVRNRFQVLAAKNEEEDVSARFNQFIKANKEVTM